MIDFYTFGTINGQATAIALELMGIPYKKHVIDLRLGEQRHPDFLAINPSGRIPVIVDKVEGKNLVISQTGAILIYLAEKSNQLLSHDIHLRAKTLQWMQFVLTDIGTNVFNNFHLKALVEPKQPQAGEILKQRAIKFCHEIDQQLVGKTYICDDQLSLADVVTFPVVVQLKANLLNGQCPHLTRWYDTMVENEAVLKGMKIGQ